MLYDCLLDKLLFIKKFKNDPQHTEYDCLHLSTILGITHMAIESTALSGKGIKCRIDGADIKFMKCDIDFWIENNPNFKSTTYYKESHSGYFN